MNPYLRVSVWCSGTWCRKVDEPIKNTSYNNIIKINIYTAFFFEVPQSAAKYFMVSVGLEPTPPKRLVLYSSALTGIMNNMSS